MTRTQVDRNERGPNILRTFIVCGLLLSALTFGYAYLHYYFVGRFSSEWVTPASRHADTFFRWVWLVLMGLTVVLGFLHLKVQPASPAPAGISEADAPSETDAPIVCRKHPFAYAITLIACAFWIFVLTMVYLLMHSDVIQSARYNRIAAFYGTALSWIWLCLAGLVVAFGWLS